MARTARGLGWAHVTVLATLAIIATSNSLGTPNLILLTALVPYALVTAVLVAVPAALSGRLALAACAVALTVLGGFWAMRDIAIPGSPTPIAGLEQVRIASLNLNSATREPGIAFAELAGVGADLILLQEVDPDGLVDIERAPLVADYPYRVLDAREGHYGSAIFSKLPLSGDVLWVDGWPMTEALIADRNLRIVNVHTVAPISNLSIVRWKAQFGELAELAATTPHSMVMAGDFNATSQHRPLRDLYSAGLHDGFLQAGLGLSPTWPTNRTGPPFMRLDRVLLTDDLVALTHQRGPLSASDHRSVIVDVQLPPMDVAN